MASPDVERMKTILLEQYYPMFSDTDLQFYIDENDGNVDDAIYQCFILKSENNAISVPGLSAEDTSSYFRRLAIRYKPRNSRLL